VKRLWLLLALLLWPIVAGAQESVIGSGVYGGMGVGGYVGIEDIVPSATICWSLRACSSALLSGTTKAVKLRRVSDNTTCDFDINTSGNLGGSDSGCSLGGGLSLASFATQDATATCTISTTTATCTGASSTPHVGSSITGAGLTQPCWASAVGTFTGGAGTVTLLGTGSSPCGTVAVGETLTFTYGLFATEIYDQTGNGLNATQATAGSQPMVLPNCANGHPCFGSNAAGTQVIFFTGTKTTANINFITSVGLQRTTQSGTPTFVQCSGGSQSEYIEAGTSNTIGIYQGSLNTVTANDNVWHNYNVNFSGSTTSIIRVDATETTGLNAGTQFFCQSGVSGNFVFFSVIIGYEAEAAVWFNLASTSTQRSNLCHNEYTYWGTGVSC
jgi:hypothetical protein